jgi:hypothetical protein
MDGMHDLRALSIVIRWRVADSTGCYSLVSNQPADSCGAVLNTPPANTFPGQSDYTSTITFESTQSHNCVAFWYSDTSTVSLPADFYLWQVLTLDSDDQVDSLQILGSAKILGGSGLLSPGLLIGNSSQTSSSLRSPQHRRAMDILGLSTFGVKGLSVGNAIGATLLRGIVSVPASSITRVATDSVTFQVEQGALTAGAYDVVLQYAGYQDTLYSAIRFANAPSYADTMAPGTTLLPEPAAAMSCPVRQFLQGGTHGATYNWAYCTGSASEVACDITDYPSYETRATGAVQTVHAVTYRMADCSGNSIPNVPVELQVLPADQSAFHCHGDNAKRDVGSASVAGVPCTPLPGGGYSCTGNTGSDGERFRVTHVWPDVGGIMNVVFFSTASGEPFYGASDVVWRFCASQSGALRENVPETPDTLVLVGSTTSHPENHWARPGMSAALLKAARALRTLDPSAYIMHVNDESDVWGGLLDITNSWGPPHRAHRYGWDADIRTNPPGFVWPDCKTTQPLYTWNQLQKLKVLLKADFTVLEHPYSTSDYTCPHLHLTLRPQARR